MPLNVGAVNPPPPKPLSENPYFAPLAVFHVMMQYVASWSPFGGV
jgi:hypothetical protein